MTRRVRPSLPLFACGLLLTAACGDTTPEPHPEVQPEATAPEALDADVLRLEFTFDGSWRHDEGLRISELRPVSRPAPAGAGLRTARQPGYCAQDVESDGTAGSNPPDTFELVTDAATFYAFGPFEWTGGAGCDGASFVPLPADPGHTPDTTNYPPDGVTCADVTLQSFFSVPFSNVYAEINEFGGTSAHHGYGYPQGTGAPDPDGVGGVLTTYGLWYYGNIDAAGGPNEAATVQWTFRNTDTSDFDFRGRVVAEISEVCGNDLDDDCDGREDEGCGEYPLTDPCVDDTDCATGFCDASNVCGAATCSNGSQDGGETDVDCGGAGCPGCVDGLLCDTGADCLSGICNLTGAGESRCRANANPGVGDVVFTEFLANIGGDDTVPDYAGEWFEVYNTTASPVSLEGCVFADDDGESSQLFGSEYVIAPGEYHVFTRTGAPAYLSAVVPAARLHEIGGITLGNASDELRLSCGGTEIDAVTWDDADLVQTSEATASQLDVVAILSGPTYVANDDRREFCAASAVYGNDGSIDHTGTPGAANAACPEFAPSFCRFQWPTARPTQSTAGSSFSAWGRVYAAGYTDVTASFNDAQPTRFIGQFGYGAVGADPNTPGAYVWADMAPNGGYDCSGCGFPENNNDEYQYTLTVPATPGSTYDLAMRFSGDLGDTWTVCDTGAGSADGWSSADAAQLEVIVPPAQPAARGDLVFTELMINLPGSSDTGEYGELLNTTGTAFDLQGCTLEDEDGVVTTIASSLVVAAGDYVVFGGPGAASEGWVDLPWTSVGGVLLDNTGDGLTLTCGGTVIDEISWSADVDTEGRSWQLDPSAVDADLNDLDVSFGGEDLKTWWCDTTSAGATGFGSWFDDGLGAMTPLLGTPGAANVACVTVDYCRLDNPRELTDVASDSVHVIEGQVYVEGLTDQGTGNNAHHMLQVQFGVGTDGSVDPENDFAWTGADPIIGWDGSAVGEPNNDGFEGVLTAPSSGGQTRDYAFRVSGDNGTTWTYCDGVVGGSNGSVDGYQAANAGQLSTQIVCGAGFWGPPACTTPCNCDNGLFCDGVEVCDNLLGCLPGTPPVAPDDGVACTVATCNEGTDSFDQVPTDTLCDDLLFCNGAETCDVLSGCQVGSAPSLSDGVSCTVDACDEVNDVITHTPDDGACDDSLFCTGVEMCDVVNGCEVVSMPSLSDGIACTVDACDEVNDVATHTPDDGACDDGAFCNGAETCSLTLGCQPGTAPTDDDGVSCTVDTCEEASDSFTHVPSDALCDDGLECTADACDIAGGCSSTPVADQIACSSCESGACECWAGICANRAPFSLDLASIMTQDCIQNTGDATQDGMDTGNYLFVTDAISSPNLPNDGFVGGSDMHPPVQMNWNDADNGNNCWNSAAEGGGVLSIPIPPVEQATDIVLSAADDMSRPGWAFIEGGTNYVAAGVNEGPGHMVFGPYITTLEEGSWQAIFNLKTDVCCINSDVLVTLDVWDSTAGQQLAWRDVRRDEFPGDDVFADYTLDFNMVGREGHAIETRVWHNRNSYIRVNTVTLRRAQPALRIFGISLDGDSTVDITAHYQDGSSNMTTHVFADWFTDPNPSGLGYLVDGLDRQPVGGAREDVNDPAIWYSTFQPIAGRELIQVDIQQVGGSGPSSNFVFFGASFW